jgi:muramoyltetrapeptide carboxypeptidase
LPRLIKPRAIDPGATLGIAAPGGPVDPDTLAAGCEVLQRAGFRVVRRDDLTARHGYLAGDDARRAAELMELVTNPDVDAIVCARGGYGCDRILDALDASAFRAARKPLVGYSDITALLLWQRRCAGLSGFHGPMLERGGDVDADAQALLLDELCGTTPLPGVLRGTGRVPGDGQGRLTGGNLMLVAASIGTRWEIDTRGAILLVEEVCERPYRIDRMLQQLRGAGKLEALAGIATGDLSTCVDERYPWPGAEEVFEELAGRIGVPLVTGLPFGHVRGNRTWPLGARATIDGDRGEIRILERGVTRASRPKVS